ncbi:MAG: deoxyribonuclease IV [Planctomycetota bacterium]|jgi:deoxyribonuclease-4
MLLGAHLSIAGGIHKALVAGHCYGFKTVAVFVRNQVQWKAAPLGDHAVKLFRRTRRRLGIRPVAAHASYLVNLARAGEVRRKSIAAMAEDLRRCGRLAIDYLVFHPGSNTDAAAGIALVAEALNHIVSACAYHRPKILLETTAGQGSSIGRTFGQLAEILSLLDRPRRFGVCLDTCHIFAAGYDIRTQGAYRQTMSKFDRIIGLEKLLVVHVNDSKRALGSLVDRHEHIGKGRIGKKGFSNIVNDPRLANVPFILETPKGKTDGGRDWDIVNAEALRRLERVGQ